MPQPNFQQQQQQPNMANNPNMMQRMPHQGMNNLNQGGNFPGNQQRMPFNQGPNQQNQMVVGQSGPSPGGGNNQNQMVVSNPGLSPFGPNSAGMTPPNSTAVVSQQNAQQMLSNRPIMSPSNEFNNMMHVKQQQSMNSQAPSPFSNNQNVYNNNMMMQSNQRMMPPTPTDMIPVPSPSPSLNSNGPPPPVSTPNTPNVASLFNRPVPTPPSMMPQSSPSHAGKGQNFNMSGGNMTNSNATGENNRSLLKKLLN